MLGSGSDLNSPSRPILGAGALEGWATKDPSSDLFAGVSSLDL